MASSAAPISMNPWEARALDYDFPEPSINSSNLPIAAPQRRPQRQDPIIYPGLYSSTGFDIMTILFQIMSRPSPQIELGAIDCSVALILCDLDAPDCPIVYTTDSFCAMTGYPRNEMLGQNCRFLQTPKGRYAGRQIKAVDKLAIHRMRQAINNQDEVQLQITNYKKSGQRFTNFLSIIPIKMAGTSQNFAVGFGVELE